jgi:hypothetical protein
MKKYILHFITLLLAICLIPLCVSAMEFDNPPKSIWPEWHTSFPYQRNIYVDFNTDPAGGPYSTGIPGADYEGWADPDLWDTDFISYTGDVIYDKLNERMGAEAIGGAASGSGIIHIDNLDNLDNYKNFWIEVHLDVSNPAELQSWLSWQFIFDDGAEYILDWAPDEEHMAIYDWNAPYGIVTWGTIYPNPLWEEIQFTFNIPENGWAWIYDVHIATECVPIPSTVWIFGAGLIGLVGIRRKFKK